MHTRDYSDDTARVIDEEVERILREQEERGRRTLRGHRAGLDAVAAALLEHETLDGAEVTRLVDEAAGRRVGGPRRPPAPTPDGRPESRPARPSVPVEGSGATVEPTTRRPAGNGGATPVRRRPSAPDPT
jgi:hypothetical protein